MEPGHAADRPDRVRRWLARRPAARTLLRAMGDGTVPVTHQGLDQVEDTETVRYIRRVLVASGVLPAHDEHLNRLQRWLHRTLADIGDPQQRRIVNRYAHWHHLRRLRARTGPHTPVTADRPRPFAITCARRPPCWPPSPPPAGPWPNCARPTSTSGWPTGRSPAAPNWARSCAGPANNGSPPSRFLCCSGLALGTASAGVFTVA